MKPRIISIGHILHVSRSGNLIINVNKIPRIGQVIFNQNLEPIGNVKDVFGPTVSPYISLKYNVQNKKKLNGNLAYISSEKIRGKNKL